MKWELVQEKFKLKRLTELQLNKSALMLVLLQSFEGLKLCIRIFEHSMQDLASLVELFKPELGRLNCLRSQSLSVFDESLFYELHHIVTTTAHTGK